MEIFSEFRMAGKRKVTLVIHPDPRLKQASAEVKVVDDAIKEMLEEMVKAMDFFNGIGLAGVQIGHMYKLAVIDHDSIVEHAKKNDLDVSKHPLLGSPLYLINPKVIEKSGDLIDSNEGCLSLPGINGDIKRSRSVKISYMDIDGKDQTLETDIPLLSACIQHEIDHNNGVLFYDHMSALKRKMVVKKMEKYIENHDINTDLDAPSCAPNCGHDH